MTIGHKRTVEDESSDTIINTTVRTDADTAAERPQRRKRQRILGTKTKEEPGAVTSVDGEYTTRERLRIETLSDNLI